MSIVDFMEKNFKHFNARETLDAAKAYHEFTKDGGKMVLALAGAMSTAEIGITLAQMIRSGKIHAVSSTAANLEEDLFNLLANNNYKFVPNYRYLSPEEDEKIRDEGYNRVTDTCIPEDVMLTMEAELRKYWIQATHSGESYFPYEYMYRLVKDGFFEGKNQIPMEHSWVVAAYEMNIPIYTPGWADSTLGNMFTSNVILDKIENHSAIKTDTMQFEHIVRWYMENDKNSPIGFFQIGGGIAGDFAMCCVPSIIQDLEEDCKHWSYFCHIGDSTLSYGSYSGCTSNEKITWFKLSKDTPAFSINSDASIVAPLIFQYVLERRATTETKNIGLMSLINRKKKAVGSIDCIQ